MSHRPQYKSKTLTSWHRRIQQWRDGWEQQRRVAQNQIGFGLRLILLPFYATFQTGQWVRWNVSKTVQPFLESPPIKSLLSLEEGLDIVSRSSANSENSSQTLLPAHLSPVDADKGPCPDQSHNSKFHHSTVHWLQQYRPLGLEQSLMQRLPPLVRRWYQATLPASPVQPEQQLQLRSPSCAQPSLRGLGLRLILLPFYATFQAGQWVRWNVSKTVQPFLGIPPIKSLLSLEEGLDVVSRSSANSENSSQPPLPAHLSPVDADKGPCSDQPHNSKFHHSTVHWLQQYRPLGLEQSLMQRLPLLVRRWYQASLPERPVKPEQQLQLRSPSRVQLLQGLRWPSSIALPFSRFQIFGNWLPPLPQRSHAKRLNVSRPNIKHFPSLASPPAFRLEPSDWPSLQAEFGSGLAEFPTDRELVLVAPPRAQSGRLDRVSQLPSTTTDLSTTWIEVQSLLVEYETHPIESLLAWIDRCLCCLEAHWQRLMERFKGFESPV